MLGFGGSFGGGGVKKYATVDDLPLTGVKPGTLAHVELNLQGVSALYLWNGSQISGGWYKVATVNLAPAIVQGPDASYSLPNDGTAVTLTLVADDPEGLPISWSFSSPDGDLTGSAVIAQDGNVFSISADPALIETQTAASFSLTFKASDGVSLSAATSVFELSFQFLPDLRNLTVSQTAGFTVSTANPLTNTGFAFSNDGLKLFITHRYDTGVVTLAAPFDISSKVSEVSFPTHSQYGEACAFSADGLSFAAISTFGSARYLKTFHLLTPFDLSTRVGSGEMSFTTPQSLTKHLSVSPDGRKFFVLDLYGFTEISLSESFSAATVTGTRYIELQPFAEIIRAAFFSENGDKLYIQRQDTQGGVTVYTLVKVFDLSSPFFEASDVLTLSDEYRMPSGTPILSGILPVKEENAVYARVSVLRKYALS